MSVEDLRRAVAIFPVNNFVCARIFTSLNLKLDLYHFSARVSTLS